MKCFYWYLNSSVVTHSFSLSLFLSLPLFNRSFSPATVPSFGSHSIRLMFCILMDPQCQFVKRRSKPFGRSCFLLAVLSLSSFYHSEYCSYCTQWLHGISCRLRYQQYLFINNIHQFISFNVIHFVTSSNLKIGTTPAFWRMEIEATCSNIGNRSFLCWAQWWLVSSFAWYHFVR